ncbi:MAG: hypothetical protein ACYCPO_06595 [Acidobacteriaceae bacterium]
MTAPKSKSAFDKLLSQSNMLASELKLLRTEAIGADTATLSDDERRLIDDRLYSLQSRAHLISDQLREMHKAFKATKSDRTAEAGSLRLTKEIER